MKKVFMVSLYQKSFEEPVLYHYFGSQATDIASAAKPSRFPDNSKPITKYLDAPILMIPCLFTLFIYRLLK